MIVRVWGEINGLGEMPMFNIGERYFFKPPQTLTGRYVCQFWAEDDFGNITNEVAVLTMFEGMVKCIEVLTREWAVTMLRDPMEVEMGSDTYLTSVIPLSGLETCADDWSVRMLPFECRDNMVEVML